MALVFFVIAQLDKHDLLAIDSCHLALPLLLGYVVSCQILNLAELSLDRTTPLILNGCVLCRVSIVIYN